MYIKILLGLLLGYVRIEVEGYYIERFINICTNRKILIWNLKRENGVKLYLNIGIKDFKSLTQIAIKTKCKIKILKKRGIPFLLHRYKKRKISIIFLIIMLGIIFLSSNYIWNIEISVEDNLIVENIFEDLKSLGISKGKLKSKIDTEKVINEIMLKRNDIAWMGIDIEGTNVKVNIVKIAESPEIIEDTDYSDIIAKKSGIITKITAQNGTAMVKVGDEIKKGDILIAGYMEGKYTDKRYVHSLGEVEAKIFYKESICVEFNEEVYKKTGKKENKYQINFNETKIKLYNKISKFEFYESNVKEKILKITNNFYLPISITKITNEEKIKETKNYNLKEAIDVGIERLIPKIEEQIENKENIINKKVETKEGKTSVIVTLIYETIENIVENRKIND